MLDPRAINEKKFKETRLGVGYAQDEVDDFLDACADTVTQLLNKIAELQQQATAKSTSDPSALMQKMLTIAQQTADQTVAEAEHNAATKLVEAGQKADTIVGQAYAQADRVKSDAAAEGERIKAEATAQRDAVLNHAQSLSTVRDTLVSQLNAALNATAETVVIPKIEGPAS